MVWLLTTDYWLLWRAGITEQCCEGTHWQQVNVPSQLQVADIALGPYNLGWLVDRNNCVYFSDNYASENCLWWQVLIRNYLFENNSILCQISTNDNSIWVTNRISPFVYKNSTSIKGHRWNEVVIKNLTTQLRWRQITAEGVFEEKGSLWLLSSANDLFHLRPDCDNVNVIALPCRAEDVASLTAAPHALWLLTHSGQIHVRQGMGDSCPQGDKWRTLNLEQISDKQVTLRHVSCGCDIIWACDTKGDMYMAVGSPYLIATDTFSPAWVQVDGRPLSNTHFVKVFVGSETHIVWALDNKNNIYVRSGIFHDYQLGTDWVLVPDLQAAEITISSNNLYIPFCTRMTSIAGNSYLCDSSVVVLTYQMFAQVSTIMALTYQNVPSGQVASTATCCGFCVSLVMALTYQMLAQLWFLCQLGNGSYLPNVDSGQMDRIAASYGFCVSSVMALTYQMLAQLWFLCQLGNGSYLPNVGSGQMGSIAASYDFCVSSVMALNYQNVPSGQLGNGSYLSNVGSGQMDSIAASYGFCVSLVMALTYQMLTQLGNGSYLPNVDSGQMDRIAASYGFCVSSVMALTYQMLAQLGNGSYLSNVGSGQMDSIAASYGFCVSLVIALTYQMLAQVRWAVLLPVMISVSARVVMALTYQMLAQVRWTVLLPVMVSVSARGSTVWALSTAGSVFCRLGISENNYIGNYWYQVPGSLCHLTASLSEGLWGVSNRTGGLVVYSHHEVPLTEADRQALTATVDRDDDWEVI
ncbi:hypothetical protein J6590_067042 [Homalodisca vitripennis]|nr:hypothetical protein J6590_067042 [Homalodisca vitripennis]